MKKIPFILLFIASCAKTNVPSTPVDIYPEMVCGCAIGPDSLTYSFLTCGCTIKDPGATITTELWQDYWDYNEYQLGGSDSLHAWVPWAINFSDGIAQGVLSFTAIDNYGNTATWVYSP